MEKSRVPNNWYQRPRIGFCMLDLLEDMLTLFCRVCFSSHDPRDECMMVIVKCMMIIIVIRLIFFSRYGCTPYKGYEMFI